MDKFGEPTEAIDALEAARAIRRGSNLDDLRRGNLSTILEMIHLQGPISRADLTRATTLNRSTVATIVNELESLGLITVSEPPETGRIGRPSAIIAPSDRYLAVAVNPELDAVTIGLVGMGGRVLRAVRYENERPPTPKETVNIVSAVLAGMLPSLESDRRIVGLGLAVPGLVSEADGLVKSAPRLGWGDVPLAEMLAEVTELPVFAGNDASCGVVAEASFGVGIGESDIVLLHGSASGIGGGVMVGGARLTGAQGYGGELGHTLVNSAGSACGCGAVGCLETEVQRAALMDLAGVSDPSALEDALRARCADDPEARAIVDLQLDFLAVALRGIVNTFNPGMVVLGGFLATLHALGGARLADVVRTTSLPGVGTEVRIVASALGRDSLLIGAAELGFATVLADPAARADAERATTPVAVS